MLVVVGWGGVGSGYPSQLPHSHLPTPHRYPFVSDIHFRTSLPQISGLTLGARFAPIVMTRRENSRVLRTASSVSDPILPRSSTQASSLASGVVPKAPQLLWLMVMMLTLLRADCWCPNNWLTPHSRRRQRGSVSPISLVVSSLRGIVAK